MDELPLVGLRQFRQSITEIDTPTRVVHTRNGVRPVGTWIPEGFRISGEVVRADGSEVSSLEESSGPAASRTVG